eukprot:1159524-Pelagomonas_calceolata.AAC.3
MSHALSSADKLAHAEKAALSNSYQMTNAPEFTSCSWVVYLTVMSAGGLWGRVLVGAHSRGRCAS